MMDDLIKRLLDFECANCGHQDQVHGEAADTLEAQAKEIARLRDELSQIEVDAMEHYNDWMEHGCEPVEATRFAFDLGNTPAQPSMESDMECFSCGRKAELRFGCCFDCATKGEEVAAKRTVLRHLSQGVRNAIRRNSNAKYDFRWAWERLTKTGDYAPGGYFEAFGIPTKGGSQ